MLLTLYDLRRRGIPANVESIARWMGLHPNGGRFRGWLSGLRDRGYLDGFTLTDAGDAAIPSFDRETGINGVLAVLTEDGQRRVLQAVLDAGEALTIEQLAERLSLHPNGGRFRGWVSWLRQMGVIPERGDIVATEGVYR